MRDIQTSNVIEGIIGTIASVSLAIPMYHEEIEFVIRVCSGLLSCTAGLFTIVAMYNKIKKYKNGNKNY